MSSDSLLSPRAAEGEVARENNSTTEHGSGKGSNAAHQAQGLADSKENLRPRDGGVGVLLIISLEAVIYVNIEREREREKERARALENEFVVERIAKATVNTGLA